MVDGNRRHVRRGNLVKIDHDDLSAVDLDPAAFQRLVRTAEDVRENAYAPYSKFRVGAAVLANDGKVYAGCNVENASYGMTICAERSALFAAVADLGEALEVEAVVIVGPSGQLASPCGACRQVIAELARDSVILFSSNSGFEHRTVDELLPDAFDLPR